MRFDELLKEEIGEFGKYQRIQYFLICLISVTSSLHSMNMVFVGPVPDHHCMPSSTDQPDSWQNLTREQKAILTYPPDEDVDDGYNECEIYNMTEIDWTTGDYLTWTNTSRTVYDHCANGWWYSKEYYDSTIVDEWDLVCDDNWKVSLGSTIFFAGRFVGAFSSGQLSDKFGRKPVFLVSVLLQVIIGCSASLAPSIEVFYVLYFLQGVVQVSVYLSSYVLGAELVGPSYRKVAGYFNKYFYSVGQMLLALVAYFIRDWRYIEIAISLPPLIFMTYYWLVPESSRWLLSVGRRSQAEQILKKAARVNGRELSDECFSQLEVDFIPDKSYSVVDVLKHWQFAKVALNIWFNWFANSLVYYGLNLNTSNLAGDPYLNFFISAAVEVPSITVALVLIDRIGRRLLFFSLMVLGGVACLATAFVPDEDDWEWLATTLSMVGKFGITASYATIYLMAAEVFPTVVRNIGMGTASMCARVGGMLAPQVVLLGDYVTPLPMLIFGVFALTGGGLGLLLPESTGKPLPQTFQDIGQQSTPINKNVVSPSSNGLPSGDKVTSIFSAKELQDGAEDNKSFEGDI